MIRANRERFEDPMDLRKTLLAASFVLLVAAALPLRAQGGCVDSPEDPTIVLALIAGAGALFAGIRSSRNRG